MSEPEPQKPDSTVRFIAISVVITALLLATMFTIHQFRTARDEIRHRAEVRTHYLQTPEPSPLVPVGENLPALFRLPDFNLTNMLGDSVGLEDLKGEVWVASFFFTECPGPCPYISSRMAELQERFEGVGGVRMVSFSLDPDQDSPEILQAYAETYGADPDRWWFLTGDREEIHTLSREGFRLTVEEAENPEDIADFGKFIHSTRIVLVDSRGVVRGYYDSYNRHDLEQLVEDAKALAGR